MTQTQLIGIIAMSVIFLLLMILAYCSNNYSLNGIKRKTVGQGQHGVARFATKAEVKHTYTQVPFDVENWRQGRNLPSVQGTIVGCKTHGKRTVALVDEGDVHTLMVGAAGIGKTAYFLYPNIELALASGMSFLNTDCKGDVFRNYGRIAQKYYGYNVSVLDLRNPTRSDENNILHLVNKYMDIYLSDKTNLSAKAKAEKYAKITAKTIISIGGGDAAAYGANAFFYDAAEGLLASLILLLAEFGEKNERHIVSVFKLIQDLLEPEKAKKSGKTVQQKSGFKSLMERLPDEHKAKWLAGSALYSADQAMMSVMSTALSRLNSFIDSEMEQILCFGTALDAEKFCREKSAIFIVLPEEDQSKYFMVSLIIQQLYREILVIADENGGKLDNRVMFYADEFGTFPKIEGAEAMFSASRSRRISIVAIIQSFAQLNKNYGKEGQEIITDNTQLTIFGGFAPNSQSAEVLSKALGEQTVLSGSVSHGKDKSQSLQMIGRPLLTVDELKSMPKGQFIVMKTGAHPMISPLKLYFKWGISFEEPYILEDKGARAVSYTGKDALMREVEIQYPQQKKEIPEDDEDSEEEPHKRRKIPRTGG
ncbi:type IV secretory system conjugative DNA transfer family protein [Porcipelethomonas ammoniilytica]|uniref:type IV secretory system conjugative DNA transfer family protein n=1 Tax=Porcipelethomonas ammoniilytica TaxID=2981722 RepID=UPI0008205CD9|nr:type IV secretory system conjugative DNA transfer family protein [Porcipelethomonas ammoniilytica]MCU6720170.1 type IV secretory system conjugative DNA transfer family protein [Porcipelethomonas ammoniilytica]SCJ04179.1 conjugal transfer coupling protein TraG [uncultured Ruminococcus sp.]